MKRSDSHNLASGKILMATGIVVVTGLLTLFQNCSSPRFAGTAASGEDGGSSTLGVCDGVSCDLGPLTAKPAVTTILMALGDEANDQLIVNGASAQLVAETVIRYTTPKNAPKILVIHDSNSGTESSGDTPYVTNVLLKRYDVTLVQEPAAGMNVADFAGYDVVWLNNPGQPMASVHTRDALLAFAGGIVIQGDDMSRGLNFDMDSLTGLHYIDNGTSVLCQGTYYPHDDNNGYQYRVSLDAAKIPGANDSTIAFKYGNDIDNTSAVRADLEVLAVAKGGLDICTAERPAIVRYLKN